VALPAENHTKIKNKFIEPPKNNIMSGITKTDNQPLVSVIIVNYNGKKFIKECLDSLKRLNYQNYEILFIDNASCDESLKIVRQNYPFVKIIENRVNLGFAAANNIAAQKAKGEYLFLLNNDTKVHPDVLMELIKVISKDPTIGICTCKLMSYDGKQYFHTGIGCDIFGYPVISKQVFYAEGSALMIKRSLFLLVGGFDPEYFMFHEDIDLAWRIQLLNYQVVPVPEAVVYHMYGGSAGGSSEKNKYTTTLFRRYYSERGNIRTILKNYSFKTLIVILPAYLLINFGEILIYSFTLKFNVIPCYIKAYYWNMVKIKNILIERKKIQQTRLVTDRDIMKKMYKGSGKLEVFKKIGVPRFK